MRITIRGVDDAYRWCIYCGADCWLEEPAHYALCPFEIGLFPVTEKEIRPHGFACVECGVEFKVGDVYVHRPLGIADEVEILGLTQSFQAMECVCVGCGTRSLHMEST